MVAAGESKCSGTRPATVALIANHRLYSLIARGKMAGVMSTGDHIWWFLPYFCFSFLPFIDMAPAKVNVNWFNVIEMFELSAHRERRPCELGILASGTYGVGCAVVYRPKRLLPIAYAWCLLPKCSVLYCSLLFFSLCIFGVGAGFHGAQCMLRAREQWRG